MASLNNLYIKKETLETLLDTINKKKEKGVELTIQINNEMKIFKLDNGKEIAQNVWVYVAQTKEQREAQKPRFTVGNGKTFWSDTQQAKPEKAEPKPKEEKGINSDDDDLPF